MVVGPVRRRLRGKQAALSFRIAWTQAARGRRFKQVEERVLEDLKSGQLFRLIRRKEYFHLLPLAGKTRWRSEAGRALVMH
jgi:hypothetical protein